MSVTGLPEPDDVIAGLLADGDITAVAMASGICDVVRSIGNDCEWDSTPPTLFTLERYTAASRAKQAVGIVCTPIEPEFPNGIGGPTIALLLHAFASAIRFAPQDFIADLEGRDICGMMLMHEAYALFGDLANPEPDHIDADTPGAQEVRVIFVVDRAGIRYQALHIREPDEIGLVVDKKGDRICGALADGLADLVESMPLPTEAKGSSE